MLTIKGVRSVQPRKVDLGRYFDEPHSVTVRALTVEARAKVQELTSEGIRYATKKAKASLDIEAIEQAMPAGVTLEIREIKLADGVVDHDIVDEGGKLIPWSKELWSALDEADPRILEAVLVAINDMTYPPGEEDPI